MRTKQPCFSLVDQPGPDPPLFHFRNCRVASGRLSGDGLPASSSIGAGRPAEARYTDTRVGGEPGLLSGRGGLPSGTPLSGGFAFTGSGSSCGSMPAAPTGREPQSASANEWSIYFGCAVAYESLQRARTGTDLEIRSGKRSGNGCFPAVLETKQTVVFSPAAKFAQVESFCFHGVRERAEERRSHTRNVRLTLLRLKNPRLFRSLPPALSVLPPSYGRIPASVRSVGHPPERTAPPPKPDGHIVWFSLGEDHSVVCRRPTGRGPYRARTSRIPQADRRLVPNPDSGKLQGSKSHCPYRRCGPSPAPHRPCGGLQQRSAGCNRCLSAHWLFPATLRARKKYCPNRTKKVRIPTRFLSFLWIFAMQFPIFFLRLH